MSARLDEMQLGAAELRQQYPWLIFVHASTVGMLADVSNKGISDAGAFFSLSGSASSCARRSMAGPEER